MNLHRTLEQKISHILDVIISDLEPNFRTILFNKIFNNGLDLSMNQLIDYSKSLLLVKNKGFGKNYWISRGWSEEYAQIKKIELRKSKPKQISVFSREFYLNKINPNTGELYTIEEADYKRNSLRPIRKEYWLIKGFSNEEAEQLAINTKQKNNKAGALASSNRSMAAKRTASHRCKEYWLNRNYTEEESINKVKNTQSTFSRKTCILKFGENLGLEIFKNRQNRWQDSLNSKSVEEMNDINKRKVSNGYSISKAEKEILSYLINSGFSADSQLTIKKLKKFYIYDIVYENKIIEYNGTYWHADPRFYSIDAKIHGKTAADIWLNDKNKKEVAELAGYKVHYVWEHDFKTNKEEELNKCIAYLKM